jgi:hypothetical protein
VGFHTKSIASSLCNLMRCTLACACRQGLYWPLSMNFSIVSNFHSKIMVSFSGEVGFGSENF